MQTHLAGGAGTVAVLGAPGEPGFWGGLASLWGHLNSLCQVESGTQAGLAFCVLVVGPRGGSTRVD